MNGLGKRYLNASFDNFIADNKKMQEAKDTCIAYANSVPTQNNLLLTGYVGTGKTLLTAAMINHIENERSTVGERITSRTAKAIDIVRSFKKTWERASEVTEEDVIAAYLYPDLLVIDEVGASVGSDTEKRFLFDVIDARYNEMKGTMIISNQGIDGITENIGLRCVDRLRQDGTHLEFNWGSKR